MITIRKATKEDVAYIAEGIFSAFLLEDSVTVSGNSVGTKSESLREKWMEILSAIPLQESQSNQKQWDRKDM